MIPLHERHLRRVLAEWMPHYNGERPHSALGPGLPDKPTGRATLTGHSLSPAHRVVASARLGGLHYLTAWKASPREFLRSTPVRPTRITVRNKTVAVALLRCQRGPKT
jgi:transposase InsO family protein